MSTSWLKITTNLISNRLICENGSQVTIPTCTIPLLCSARKWSCKKIETPIVRFVSILIILSYSVGYLDRKIYQIVFTLIYAKFFGVLWRDRYLPSTQSLNSDIFCQPIGPPLANQSLPNSLARWDVRCFHCRRQAKVADNNRSIPKKWWIIYVRARAYEHTWWYKYSLLSSSSER